jgi:hypothetical protein
MGAGGAEGRRVAPLPSAGSRQHFGPTPLSPYSPRQTPTFALAPGRLMAVYQRLLDPTRWAYSWLDLTGRGGGYVTLLVDSAGKRAYGYRYELRPLPVFEPPDVDVYTLDVQNNVWFGTGSCRFAVQVCQAGTAAS